MPASASGQNAFDRDKFLNMALNWPYNSLKYPLRLEVEVNEPITEQREISVCLAPLDPKEAGMPEGLKICLYRQYPRGNLKYALHTALSLVRQRNGCDFTEGLAFMVQRNLQALDPFRALSGSWSLLDLAEYWNVVEIPNEDEKRRYLATVPRCPLEWLIDFWNLYLGVLTSKAYVPAPRGIRGRPSFLTIPPSWIPEAPVSEPILIKPEREVALVKKGMVPVAEKLPEIMCEAELGRYECVFRKTGDSYAVLYDGKYVSLDATIGAAYIAFLLDRPSIEYPILQLVGLVESSATTADLEVWGEQQYDKTNKKEEVPSHSETGDTFDVEDMLDETAREQYQARIRDLDKGIILALQNGEEEKAEELSSEKKWIQHELKSTRNILGDPRKFADKADKERRRVLKNVDLVRKRLAEEIPALGIHLKNSIKISRTCHYTPESPRDWLI